MSEKKTNKTVPPQSPKKEAAIGDRVRVYFLVKDQEKERETFFEGRVIAKKGQGKGKTITVRRVSTNHIAIERIFPLYSPLITKIQVLEKAKKVRRAKLYYLRQK